MRTDHFRSIVAILPRSREAGWVLTAAKIAAGVCLLNLVPVPRFLPSALIPHLLLTLPPCFSSLYAVPDFDAPVPGSILD